MFDVLAIRARTIHMRNPQGSGDVPVLRRTVSGNKSDEELVLKEAYLRKWAYRNTLIKTGESFFDDSDMRSDYYLTLIYDSRTGTPLLSSRYFFERAVINKNLAGEENQTDILNREELNTPKIFLIDRLSGNTSGLVYRRRRNFIFLLYYSELLKYNRGSKFIIMARKEAGEKLLKKYLALGFRILGLTKHKGMEHWILLSDFKKGYSEFRFSAMLNLVLLLRGLIFKI